MTSLPSAKELLAAQPETQLGNAQPDPLQPAELLGTPDQNGQKQFFSFGKQPIATRDVGKREKVGVVAAGDVWEKFFMPSLVQRGSEVYVCDKKFEASSYPALSTDEAEQAAKRERDHFEALVAKAGASDRIHIVQGGLDKMPDDLSYITVLTPPSSHLAIIKQAMTKNVPIAVEKPLVATQDQAAELEKMLRANPHPLYCIDWQVMHALPMLKECGLNMPFADALQTDVQDPEAYARFKQAFKLENVKSIDARFVEGGDNQLGDIATAMKNRPELFDYSKGGGILFDMAVHPLNVLAALGFKSTHVEKGFLGVPSQAQDGSYTPGEYKRFGKEEGATKTGEIYGRAKMQMGIKGGSQNITTMIEAAKGAKFNDGRLVLSDGHYELRWEMFPNEESGKGSKLEIKENGKVIATSTLTADCYALILQDIANFSNHAKATGEKQALYLPEHRDMITTIAKIHDLARNQDIPHDEPPLLQLKISEMIGQARGVKPTIVHPPRNPLVADGTSMSVTPQQN